LAFKLRYEQMIQDLQNSKPRFFGLVLEPKGEVFFIEPELVVFYESAQPDSRPLYAAGLRDLHYIERQNTGGEGPGFAVSGQLPGGDKIDLWAEDAQTFYSEQGFAVFYDRPDRSGRQVLAIRCSDVRSIEWQPQKPPRKGVSHMSISV
jgi:hypothetical protein